MQLRLNPDRNKFSGKRKLIIKTILIASVLFLIIFLLGKIEMAAPIKLIKQEISNDKLITLK